MIKIGKKAPLFSLNDSNGVKISLDDFRGRKVILYFYPKDNTPGCTKEACDFREFFPNFNKAKVAVIGISPDSIESHKKFIQKYDLPFILLSDERKEVLKKYDVWKEKSLYGKKYMGVERTTVIIDEDGKVMKYFPKVKVEGHVEEVLAALKN
jgi:peroxiredoxin Q/BCP